MRIPGYAYCTYWTKGQYVQYNNAGVVHAVLLCSSFLVGGMDVKHSKSLLLYHNSQSEARTTLWIV